LVSPDSPCQTGDNSGPKDSIADLLALIRAEYDEMPGLSLTPAQVCRLFGIDSHTGETAMLMLVDEGVLVRSGTGAFRRRKGLM
jgi:hypothetical protein